MGVHCYLTELGTVVTMAAKILAVVASLASLAAAEPGYGVAYHPYGGSSSVYRSTQGLTGYGHGYHGYGYGKRDAEAGYGYGHGYGAASVYVSQADHGYGYNPAHYTYGYNIGHGYGKRSADAEPGYHGHAVSYTHRAHRDFTATMVYTDMVDTDMVDFTARGLLMPSQDIMTTLSATLTEAHKDFTATMVDTDMVDTDMVDFMARGLLSQDIMGVPALTSTRAVLTTMDLMAMVSTTMARGLLMLDILPMAMDMAMDMQAASSK